MENDGCEKNKQTSIPFRCKKVVPTGDDANISDSGANEGQKDDLVQNPIKDFESPTPEKAERRSKVKDFGSLLGKRLSDHFQDVDVSIQPSLADSGNCGIQDSSISECIYQTLGAVSRSESNESNELPQGFKALSSLFNAMQSSIRLLNLRKKLPILDNICRQVEALTKRKLLCSHLAQMKFVFPEAICIEKILVHDDNSLCMKPDMKISLQFDAIKDSLGTNQSPHVALCQAFHERLFEFCKDNPGVHDIPKANLPEPFCEKNYVVPCTLPTESSLELLHQVANVHESMPFFYHLPSSFDKQFSKKMNCEPQRTELLVEDLPLSLTTVCNDSEIRETLHEEEISSVSHLKPPVVACTPNHRISQLSENTPKRDAVGTGLPSTKTPSLQPPERPIPTPNQKHVNTNKDSGSDMTLTRSARRPLVYSPSSDVESMADMLHQTRAGNLKKNNSSDRSLSAVDDVSLKSVRGLALHTTNANEDHSSSETRRNHQEMIVCLQNTFDIIRNISRSLGCSFITKEELFHKIIAQNLEIEDTGEVEEQLGLLEEFIPDWISKKTGLGGNTIYSFKKTSGLESVRAKLVEAI